MKKIVILMMFAVTLMAMPLFAADHILRTGMWTEASDLRDFRTPEELDYTLNPYVYYELGRFSNDDFTAYGTLDVPYTIGDAFDTLWPSLGAGFDYRIHAGQDAIMQSGLSLASAKYGGSTIIDAVGHFHWYPYNQATEVIVHPHESDFVEGLRLGLGLDAGATFSNLLEDADITTDLYGSLVGKIVGGAQLSDRFWFQSQATLAIPAIFASSTFDTYSLFASGEFDTTFSYQGDRMYLSSGLSGSLNILNILTQDGFLEGTSYDYAFSLTGEAGFFVIEDLNVYGGFEFSGVRGVADDSAVVYVGLEYYLL